MTYKHGVIMRKGVDPVVTLGLFVCPTVSMVNTSKAAGLEGTLSNVLRAT